MMALAHHTISLEAREILAVDYFMNSLGDPDLVLKIREREPATLDEVLKIALRLEVWQKDSLRGRNEDKDRGRDKQVRSVEIS